MNLLTMQTIHGTQLQYRVVVNAQPKFLIVKNDCYLSHLFVNDVAINGFKAKNPNNAYWYDSEEIAQDIASNLGAHIIEVPANSLKRFYPYQDTIL